MAGVVIGRVSVKVWPDTSEFRRKLKDDLEREEERLKVLIPIDFDKRQALRALRNTVRELNAEVRDQDKYKVKLQATISDKGMKKEVRRAAEKMTALAKDDKVKFKAEVNADALDGAHLNVKLHVTDEEVRKLHDTIQHRMEPIKVKLDPRVNPVSKKYVQGQLAALTRPRFAEILLRVNKSSLKTAGGFLATFSGANHVIRIVQDLRVMKKVLDETLPKVAAVSTAILGISGAALSASSNVFALGGSIAQIIPIGLALPGVLAGIVTGLAITKVGFAGITERMPELGKKFTALKKIIQDNFWKGASDGIQALADVYLPELGKSATELGVFWGKLTKEISKPFKTELPKMFDDLRKSIAIATGGASAFANIITVLGTQGASYLPRLAKWFVKISTQFSNFLTRAQKDGSLTRWINTGITNLKHLFSIAGSVYGILKGLAKAGQAAGGTLLGDLAKDLKSVSAIVNSAPFQKTLVGVLTAANQMMDNISKGAGPGLLGFFKSLSDFLTTQLPALGTSLGELLGGIATGLGSIEVNNGAVKFFKGLESAMSDIVPILPDLSKKLGALLGILGTAAESFGPVLATTLDILAQVLTDVAPVLDSVIQNLSGPLAGILKALADPVERIVKAVGPKIGDLAKWAGDLAKSLTPQIGTVAGQIASFVEKVVAAAGRADWKTIGGAIGSIASDLLGIAGDIVSLASAITGKDGSNITNFFDHLGDAAADTATHIHEIRTGFDDLSKMFEGGGFAKDPKGITHMLTGSTPSEMKADFVRDMKSALTVNLKVAEVATFILGSQVNLTGAIGELLIRGLKGGVKALVNGFKPPTGTQPLFKAILHAVLFGNNDINKIVTEEFNKVFNADLFSTILFGPGKDIINGLIKGMSDGNPVKEFLSWLTDNIPLWKGPASRDRTLLTHNGEVIMQSLINGFKNALDKVQGWLKDLTDSIVKWFNKPTLLTADGVAVVTGFAKALAGGGGLIASAIQRLLGTAKDKADRPNLLYGAGQRIAGGLASGISSKGGAISSAISSLLGSAKKSGSGGVSLYSVGRSIGLSLASGIRSAMSDVRAAANALVAAARPGAGMPEQNGGGTFGPSIDSVGGSKLASVSKALSSKISAGLAEAEADNTGQQAGVALTINQYNPVAEPTSVSANRALRAAALYL